MSTTVNLGITKLDAGIRQPEIVVNNALDTLDAQIGGAWASWTPTWTNVTVGNGVVVAKYKQIGKLAFARISLVLGSTSSVSGLITFSLPVTRATYAGGTGSTILGMARLADASVPVSREGAITSTATTTASLIVFDASGTYLTGAATSGTVPFTWTTSDEFAAQIVYEAA
jgi:hypothetical protein